MGKYRGGNRARISQKKNHHIHYLTLHENNRTRNSVNLENMSEPSLLLKF